MDGEGRVRTRRQALPEPQPGGQRVAETAHVVTHALHEAAQQARRHLLARRVHGHEPLGVHALVVLAEDLVAAHKEGRPPAPGTEGAAHAEVRPRFEHPGQIALVEPRGLDGAGVVANDGAHDGDPFARRPLGGDLLDEAAHGRLLAQLEVAHVLTVAVVGVAPGEVLDEVADGLQAEGGQAAGGDLADARQAVERPAKPRGVDAQTGGRRLAARRAGETRRERRPAHSTIMVKAAAPGPMCVPTTAPTWVAKTNSAFGRACSMSSRICAGSVSLSASITAK